MIGLILEEKQFSLREKTGQIQLAMLLQPFRPSATLISTNCCTLLEWSKSHLKQ